MTAIQAEKNRKLRPERNYPTDPIGYAADILGVILTDDQKEILRAALHPPYMVKVESGHNVGKSFLGAVLVNWHYDNFDPGVVVTTAPTKKAVEDLLWAEVRLQRQGAHGPKLRQEDGTYRRLDWDFSGTRSTRMATNDDHWAEGYTTERGESFQGRHRERMLFLFDEDEGIALSYYTTTRSMFKPDGGHIWVTFCNPTTTTSAGFIESQKVKPDGTPVWRVFSLSAMDHPNIKAELANLPRPVPAAVSVGQINEWVTSWCERVPTEMKTAIDFEWPFGSNQYWRPGPEAEARIFGLRPEQGTNGVWSMALWQACEKRELPLDLGLIPEIGADCAWKGDDYTAFHIRWGGVSLRHESFNGWQAPRIALHIQELCLWAANLRNEAVHEGYARLAPQQIPVKIDDDATGGAVSALLSGYRIVPISASTASFWKDRYPNQRSELWFNTRDRAMTGLLSVSQLPREVLEKLKIQLLAVKWEPDAARRRLVEKKEKTKEVIGRSPDDADAMNLAYFQAHGGVAEWADPVRTTDETMGEKKGFLGRGEQSSYRKPTRRTLGR